MPLMPSWRRKCSKCSRPFTTLFVAYNVCERCHRKAIKEGKRILGARPEEIKVIR